MTRDLTLLVADNLSMEPEDVSAVVAEFMLQLHRRMVEYEGISGDYIGGDLQHDISPQAFFHFLGFLDRFSELYQWEPGTAIEYIERLFSTDDWLPYSHQLEGWKESSFYCKTPSTPNPEGNL